MFKRLIVLGALGALLAAPAQAQTTIGGVGPRVGFSVDPDQLVFGGQLIIGEIAPQLTFDPSLEFGFGDHATVIAANFDLHYHFNIQGTPWRPYAGAGVGLNFTEFDNGPFRDTSDTAVGGNLVVGAGVPTSAGNRFFGELKLGLGDIPTLKMLAGWNFKI
jgi:hypothetical protein